MAVQLSENEKLLIEAASIPEYFNRFIIPNKRLREPNRRFTNLQKANSSAICPFHVDSDPSLHFWSRTKTFKCFGCGASGDVIRMHQLWVKSFQSRDIDREQAMVELAALFGVTLEETETGSVLPVMSPAEKARALLDPDSYSGLTGGKTSLMPSAMSTTGMALTEFVRIQNQVIDSLKRQPNLPAQVAASRYYSLDLRLSESLIQKV